MGSAHISLRLSRAIVAVIACSLGMGCVESEFQLTSDSRLPRWFSLPANLKRSDVTVASLTSHLAAPASSSRDLTKRPLRLQSVRTGLSTFGPNMRLAKELLERGVLFFPSAPFTK